MKKTLLTLLLAASSIATAATEIDLTGKWDGNTVDISSETFNKGEVTVAVNLNREVLTKVAANQKLFYLSGTNYTFGENDQKVYGTAEIGMSNYTGYGSELNAFRYDGAKDSITFNNGMPLTFIPMAVDFSYATVVFTAYTSGNNSRVQAYLYLFDAAGNIIEDNLTLTAKYVTLNTNYDDKNDTYSHFTINETATSTDGVKIYNGLVSSKEELTSIAKSMVVVPEPTTATLSLLALAGLAMRRRRK